MNTDLSVIKLDNIEVPMTFFETNLRVKSKLDELFKNNSDKLNKVICEMRDACKKTYNIRYEYLSYDYLQSRFKFYFCKSIVIKAVNDAFSQKGSRYSFERNVIKHLNNVNLEEAMYGDEIHNTFSKIAFSKY